VAPPTQAATLKRRDAHPNIMPGTFKRSAALCINSRG
jgi:hypothetical protein